MREIRFRVWDRKQKIMAYLDWNKINTEADCGIKQSSHFFGYQVWLNFVLPAINVKGQYQEDPYLDLVVLEWMQYTGLKDKNGKEIYEGDIVKSSAKGIRAVFWDEDDGCFSVDGTYFNRIVRDGQVIGNIYENPELLKEKE